MAGEPTVAQPDFAKPPRAPAAAPVSDIDAQPDRLGTTGSPSMSIPCAPPGEGATAAEVLAAVGAAGGLGILMPAAAAILRSSFSSRLRSFSLRLSTSSWGLMRTFACMSLKRALWWCAYELVCSSYCATFLNCLSHSVQ